MAVGHSFFIEAFLATKGLMYSVQWTDVVLLYLAMSFGCYSYHGYGGHRMLREDRTFGTIGSGVGFPPRGFHQIGGLKRGIRKLNF